MSTDKPKSEWVEVMIRKPVFVTTLVEGDIKATINKIGESCWEFEVERRGLRLLRGLSYSPEKAKQAVESVLSCLGDTPPE